MNKEMPDLIAPQPPPKNGKDNVHDWLFKEYGDVYGDVLDDLWQKALQSQEKYNLDRPGLYTFNGRDALVDAYQEILDLAAYLGQYVMENSEPQGLVAFYARTALYMAQDIREKIQGNYTSEF